MAATYQEFRDGQHLIGDDYSSDEINAWFRDEENGYFELAHDRMPGTYGYHALNWRHGFKHLPHGKLEHVLGMGSAFGEELGPVLERAKKVTILEPADGFASSVYTYVKPNPSGIMPFADKSFDLITCFGVLHHIPNVTVVVREMGRCMKHEGHLLLREPTHSMGDWDYPRRGLTSRERGIPIDIMRSILREAGFDVVRERWCMFPITSRSQRFLPAGQSIYNLRWITAVDDLVSNLPWWSHKYHAKNFWERFRPGSVFSILRKNQRSN